MNQEFTKEEKKRAKRDHRETIRLNPEGYQTERLKLQRHVIDVKAKSKGLNNFETINSNMLLENEFEGRKQECNVTITQYQGNTSIGYSSQLLLTK